MALRSVKVIFKDSKYNYSTSINGTNEEIERYFVGALLNMGGIRYDHKNDREIEVDDLQSPIGVEFLDTIEAESGTIIVVVA